MTKRKPVVRPPKKDKYVIDTFVPEVSKAEQTPAYKIFHTLYQCQVANIHTESLESMLKRQPYGNEHGAAGMRYAQELRFVYLTIAGMTELTMEGATIHLLDNGQSKEIYETIKDHLRSWARHVELSINRMDLPEDDLRALDMFAAIVYPHARYDIERTGSDNWRDSLFGRNGRNALFRRHNAEQQKVVDQAATGYVETPMQHQSMMDILANPPPVIDKVKSKWT